MGCRQTQITMPLNGGCPAVGSAGGWKAISDYSPAVENAADLTSHAVFSSYFFSKSQFSPRLFCLCPSPTSACVRRISGNRIFLPRRLNQAGKAVPPARAQMAATTFTSGGPVPMGFPVLFRRESEKTDSVSPDTPTFDPSLGWSFRVRRLARSDNVGGPVGRMGRDDTGTRRREWTMDPPRGKRVGRFVAPPSAVGDD